MATNKKVSDGFVNVNRALGSSRDITTNTTYSNHIHLSNNYYMVNGLYRNHFGGKAVDIPVDDAFKGGRLFTIEDENKLKAYKDYLKHLKLDKKIEFCMKWAKIFGSAVLIIVSNDDEMSEPLIPDNIKKGDVQDIIVLDRWQLYSMDINRDPMSSNFLQPQYYYVTRTSTKIHHTRVIKLDGLDTTLYDKELLNGWGLSIYERLYKNIQNAQMSPDLLINLLIQSNLDVFHIEGLNEAVSSGNDDLAIKRGEVAMEGKSIFNGLMLDSKDNYTNIAKNFAGLEAVHNVFIDLICSAADIPKTRFMNIQSAGLANDGTGDLMFYYDRIETNERATLREVYDYLDPILSKSLFGDYVDIDYEFKSLYQMTEEQKSIIRNRDAQTDQINIDRGIITELEAKAKYANDPYYPTITPESIEEERKLLEEMKNFEPVEYEPTKE